ncbi:uncharacterized protein LOC144142471 [Haemaphysalis longicornis]
MHRTLIVLWLLFVVFVVLVHTQRRVHRVRCSSREVAVWGKPQRDIFCQPRLTRPSERKKLRFCLCKRGYVRNAWGACIRWRECRSCGPKSNQDFNPCGTVCPLTCKKLIPGFCSVRCVVGCACPPGYVRHPNPRVRKCVSARSCPPKCPANSKFHLCVSSCEPRCYTRRPKKCVTWCYNGDCVCQNGYAKTITNGRIACVPIRSCYSFGWHI